MKRILIAIFLLLSTILTSEIQVDEGLNEFRIYEKETPRNVYFSVEKDKVFIGNNYNSTEFFLKGAFNLGKDDTGHDFKLYGATSGSYLLWDESADTFYIVGGDADVDGAFTASTVASDAGVSGTTGTFTSTLSCLDLDVSNDAVFDSLVTINGNVISTELNGDTLGTATGGTFVTYASRANQTVITFSNYKMVITDSEGSGGHGSIELIDFPEGMIDINGIVADVSIDSVSGIAADGTFDMGIGTVTTVTDNEALSTSEQDLVNKVDGTLVGGADTIDLVNVTLANLDGHTTAKECYLNVAVTDANMTATGWVSIYGTIVVTWINLGDY